MVKKETVQFVEANREMLEKLAKHGSEPAKALALAFLEAVDKENMSGNDLSDDG